MARGGPKAMKDRKGTLVLSHIIKDTTMGSPQAVHMRGLEGLVANTTGLPAGRPVMEGVLVSTVPAGMRDTPELMPVHEKDATASKMAVGRTFSGPKSGYGKGGKSRPA
jgi:hypothetical protein